MIGHEYFPKEWLSRCNKMARIFSNAGQFSNKHVHMMTVVPNSCHVHSPQQKLTTSKLIISVSQQQVFFVQTPTFWDTGDSPTSI